MSRSTPSTLDSSGVEQPQQQPGHRDRRGHLGGDLRRHAAAVVGGMAAERGQRRDEHALAGVRDAGHGRPAARRPCGPVRDSRGPRPRRAAARARRCVAGPAGRGHRDVVRDQPGHGLAVGVEQPGHAGGADRPDDRQQRPRPDQHDDPVPHRSFRQVQRRAPGPAGHRLLGLRRPVGLAQQQAAAPPGLLELEHQAGPVQPPVEGVEPGAPALAAAARTRLGGHRERLAERGEHGGQEVLLVPGEGLKDESSQARRCHVGLPSRQCCRPPP